MRKLLTMTGVFVITHAFAQQPTFVNKWKLDLSNTALLLSDSARVRYDTLKPSIRNSANENMDGREFHINSDSTIDVQWKARGIARNSNGTWRHMPAHNTIVIEVSALKSYFKIIEVSSNHLVLEQSDKGTLFPQLYFTRLE